MLLITPHFSWTDHINFNDHNIFFPILHEKNRDTLWNLGVLKKHVSDNW